VKYNYSNRRKIKGWLSEIDNSIFETVLSYQKKSKIIGATAEVGLHHGKSFIPLCLYLTDEERAYGIDLFENQELNLDSSGNGSLERVVRNLGDFGISKASYLLDGRSSDEVSPSDILQSVGKVRFFSIDGGHWEAIVENDLQLAAKVLVDEGVIALDDYLRPEWPGVASGFHKWYQENHQEFQIFAIGFNKAYLCKHKYVNKYQEALKRNEFLSIMKRKDYDMKGAVIPVFYNFFLPEWSVKARAYGYLQLFHPFAFQRFKRIKKKFKSDLT
jgi:hypothetical protein